VCAAIKWQQFRNQFSCLHIQDRRRKPARFNEEDKTHNLRRLQSSWPPQVSRVKD